MSSLEKIASLTLLLMLFTVDEFLFSRDVSNEMWQWKQELNSRKRATSGFYYS